MAGLDGNGLTIKRLPDILEELQAEIRLQYGNDTPVDENSFFGILNTIYGAESAEIWELIQTLYNAGRPSTAEDKQLDDIASFLRLTRLQPTKSSGIVTLSGDEDTVVPLGTQFSDSNGEFYESLEEVILDVGISRTPVNINPTSGGGTEGELSTTYQITINGDVFNHQFTWGDSSDIQAIAEYFSSVIIETPTYYVESYTEGNPDFLSQSSVISGLVATTFLNIINKNPIIPLTVSTSIVQSPDSNHFSNHVAVMENLSPVATFKNDVNVQATLTGDIITPPHTLINIETPVVGLDTVDNPTQMIRGRDLETNEQLRSRIFNGQSINSFSTKESIDSVISQTEGVSLVEVISNDTFSVDIDGRPPKSFECLVVGGTDESIARAILSKAPVGIESYGSSSYTITDVGDIPVTIYFSRPTLLYFWVKIYYTKNEEEIFPLDGEAVMAISAINYGDSLGLGDDVIPKRFYGDIYRNTKGIEDLTVKFAISVDPLIEPDLVDFNENIRSVASDEIADFASYRTEVIEE